MLLPPAGLLLCCPGCQRRNHLEDLMCGSKISRILWSVANVGFDEALHGCVRLEIKRATLVRKLVFIWLLQMAGA